MKTTKYLLLGAALFSLAFTSCSKDDDDDNNSSTSVEFDTHAVDLGLPSGTLWADQNVGAKTPEEFGGYYAWGAIITNTSYTSDTYKVDTKSAGADWGGNPQFDIATLTYGGNWRTPNYSDYNELILNTKKEWTEINGVKGLKFIGTNGNSVFLPAAGYSIEESFQRVGFLGAVRILAMMEPVSELKSMRAVQDKLVTMATKAVLYVPSRRNDKNRQY